LDKAGITPYRLAKDIGREPSHIYRWLNGTFKISPLLEEKVRAYFKKKGIDIIEK